MDAIRAALAIALVGMVALLAWCAFTIGMWLF